MKFPHSLIAVCTSLLCTSWAYAEITCPEPHDFPEGWEKNPQSIHEWEFDKWKSNKPTDPRALKFASAWIYDPSDPRGATCLYRGAGGSLHLKRPEVNLTNHHYKNTALQFNMKNHGVHCKGPEISDCVIEEGPFEPKK